MRICIKRKFIRLLTEGDTDVLQIQFQPFDYPDHLQTLQFALPITKAEIVNAIKSRCTQIEAKLQREVDVKDNISNLLMAFPITFDTDKI